MKLINELFEFIRLRISLFGSFIAVSGFLIFNEINFNIFLVALGGFFISATTYSFNMLTDKEEDLINKKKLNPFVLNEKRGELVVLFCFLFSLFFSYLLGFFSLIVAFILLFFNLSYSYFRFKKKFVLKNLFTALMSFPLFFYGSLLTSFSPLFLFYSSALFLFVLIVSMTGDLRDYVGDKKAGLKTFATVFGLSKANKFIYFIFILFSSIVLFFQLIFFYALIPFVLFASVLVYLNRVKLSLKYLLMGMIFVPFFVFLLIGV